MNSCEPGSYFEFIFDYQNLYVFQPGDTEITMADSAGKAIPVTWISYGYRQGETYTQQWIIKTSRKITRETVAGPVKVRVTLFKACTFTYDISF